MPHWVPSFATSACAGACSSLATSCRYATISSEAAGCAIIRGATHHKSKRQDASRAQRESVASPQGTTLASTANAPCLFNRSVPLSRRLTHLAML